jgi:hypothetical protein
MRRAIDGEPVEKVLDLFFRHHWAPEQLNVVMRGRRAAAELS